MRLSIFLLVTGFFLSGNLYAQVNWPDGKKAAIVLTYDDGLKSQYNIVIPQLEKRHFRGTFFLYGEVVKTKDIPCWEKAAKNGHELGNHSLFHPCLSGTTKNEPSAPCHHLECYSVKGMITEIEMMNVFLYALDGKEIHAYAYPCGQTVAGGEDYSVALSESGVVSFARGGGDHGIITNSDIDFFKTPTYSVPSGANATEMITEAKNGLDKGGLVIFVFHGVGGDYLTVDAGEHEKLLDYLDQHSKEIWVTTYSGALNYLSSQKQ